MIDKQALSRRFEGFSEIFNDCDLKEDLKAASYVIANMGDERYEELINKEAFRLPGMDKLKGFFKNPASPEKVKPGEFATTPNQRAQNIKDQYRDSGPSGKLLTVFSHKEVQNAYQDLPPQTKKLVDRYIIRWKTGDLVGKAAAEEKEALFEDKSPAGVYKAFNSMLDSFSKKYDVSLLPTALQSKFEELKGTIKTIEESPERLPKDLTPEEKDIIDKQKQGEPFSKQDIDNDNRINKFLQVMDRHFKNDLQKNMTPALKNEYVKMTGEIVGQLKGDIEQGFRDSGPGAMYQKKSPYVPKKPAPAAKKPAPAAKKPAPADKKPAAPTNGQVSPKEVPVTVRRASILTSEGVELVPAMVEINKESEEIKNLSKILANNEL